MNYVTTDVKNDNKQATHLSIDKLYFVTLCVIYITDDKKDKIQKF